MEPPNKRHVGDNINSAVLSFIERLSSFRGSECTKPIGHVIFGTSNSLLCREVLIIIKCPHFGGSTIGGSTVDPKVNKRSRVTGCDNCHVYAEVV